MRLALISLVLWMSAPVLAGPKDPITGEAFDSLLVSQNDSLQDLLEKIIDESEGFLVTGPIEANPDGSEWNRWIYGSVRIICPNLEALNRAVEALSTSDSLKLTEIHTFTADFLKQPPVGFRGVLAELARNDDVFRIQLTTIHQTRWLLWALFDYAPAPPSQVTSENANWPIYMKAYQERVSDYFYRLDNGRPDAKAPRAADMNLPENFDLFAPPPPYVIDGYQNYLDFLYAHREIRTSFAQGITAFVPTDSLMAAIINEAPREAFPNKEAPMLQHEYRKFFERDGDLRVMATLTRGAFDTLRTGEYFFAVSVRGEIRFGRELLRSEVERLETETGRKVPRANHAFLFPGEPVLTAGAFFVESSDKRRISRVTAQSGHYFYSNVSPGIREDISVNSDHYLTTLGHFFKALDSEGIPYEDVLISKF